MGIVAKHIIVGNGEVKSSPEPVVKKVEPVSFSSIRKQLFKETVKEVVKEEVVIEQKVIEVHPEESKYETIKDGDLHKLYNTKSEYLKDMVSLKKQ